MSEEVNATEPAAESAEPEREVVGVCADCGETIYEGDKHIVDHEGRLICESCKDDYVECCDCGEWYAWHDTRDYNGERLCDDCFDADDYTTCDGCGCVINRSRDEYEVTANDRTICKSCYESSYRRCERCDEIYHEDDGRHVDGYGWCCRDCADEVGSESESESGVMDYHDFDRSRYEPRVVDGESPDETLCFGVELEVDNGAFDSCGFSRWVDDDDLVHFEHDGSLSSRGVECITMPCSLKFHQERMEWAKLCAKFREQGFLSHGAETCGLHVHMTRRLLPIQSIVKMDVWLNRWFLWRNIARRKSIYGGRYDDCKRIDIDHAIENTPVKVPPLLLKHRTYEGHDRYQPLNTNRRETVEARIFKGTLNPETILGTIESLDAMVQFAPTVGITKVYDHMLPLGFVKFMAESKEKYPHVFPMLERLAKAADVGADVKGEIDKNV